MVEDTAESVRAAARGDRAAFETLVHNYAAMVSGVALPNRPTKDPSIGLEPTRAQGCVAGFRGQVVQGCNCRHR